VELDAGVEVGGGASSSSMSRVASTTCARPRAPLASRRARTSMGRVNTHCAGLENRSCIVRLRDWEEGVGPAYGSVKCAWAGMLSRALLAMERVERVTLLRE
jgi:hypothetical protein